MQKQFAQSSFSLGLLGGGQLGRMLIQEAMNLNVAISVLDPDINAPCRHLTHDFHHGNLTDFDTVMKFGEGKDLITIEIENVNVDALEELEKRGIPVYPQSRVLRIIQDKGNQKIFFQENGIPTPEFKLIKNKSELEENLHLLPVFQKLRKGGYDGRGVQSIKNKESLDKAFDAPSVLESYVDFEKELSVIVARNKKGEIRSFPVFECEFNPEANLVEFLFTPAQVSPGIWEKASLLAEEVIRKLDMVGILAVEMFLTKSGEVLVNEIAPRPHNSGHSTIEGNITSQFEQHLRAILDLPLGNTGIVKPSAMINLLGEAGYSGDAYYEGIEEVLSIPEVYVHLYGKKVTKPFRKMGHITLLNDNVDELRKISKTLQNSIKVISK